MITNTNVQQKYSILHFLCQVETSNFPTVPFNKRTFWNLKSHSFFNSSGEISSPKAPDSQLELGSFGLEYLSSKYKFRRTVLRKIFLY